MLCKLFVVTALGAALATPTGALAKHRAYADGFLDYKIDSGNPPRFAPDPRAERRSFSSQDDDPDACWVWWEGQRVLVC